MEFQIVPISYRCSKDLLLWLIKSSSHIQSGMCIQSGTYELLISLRIINMHLPVPANLYSDLILNMLVIIVIIIIAGLRWWLSGKESSCNVGDSGSIPGSGRSPRGGLGNPLQYSCLENPVDRGAWWTIVHGITKSQMQLKGLNAQHTAT